jgi:PPK2 family polyphosphate:nucleotide phosphotransferase
MTTIDSKPFLVAPNQKVNLGKFSTKLRALADSSEEYAEALDSEKKRMAEIQERLYASGTHAILIVFQGMDAAGKDGMIKNVMSGLNPQGVQVSSFKRPSEEELNHGIFWRHDRALPEHGEIGIWNRSHYEEVLVVRVHPELLRARGIEPAPFNDPFWKERLAQIARWEEHQNDTSNIHIIKFFLHVSKHEQAERLLARIEDKSKNWKFEAMDMEERKHWGVYTKAFEELLARTSSKKAPWYIIPADDKKAARLLVSRIINERLEEFDLEFPKPKTPAAKLKEFAAELRAELDASA